MQIDHIAIWTNQLERMKDFYEIYFQAKAGSKYQNIAKQFESYFLSFSSGTQIELMSRPGICDINNVAEQYLAGYTHICFTCGSEKSVDELTERIRKDGFQVMGGPRQTGDNYYESVVLDPDGNRVELTA
jgi:lactoylglutathione lyase